MEDYLILQICRVKLQEALDSGRKEEMIESLKYSTKVLPYSVARNGLEETRVIMYGNNVRPVKGPVEWLDEMSARWSVQGFIAAVDKEFSYVQYRSYREPFERCMAVLGSKAVWWRGDVLYGHGSRALDVEGFLRVCSYAVEVGEALSLAFDSNNELYDEAAAAVSVFKGLELVLGNRARYCAVPQIQMIHLANDFLVKAVKPSLEKVHNQDAVGMGLLVDLACDFFSAK